MEKKTDAEGIHQGGGSVCVAHDCLRRELQGQITDVRKEIQTEFVAFRLERENKLAEVWRRMTDGEERLRREAEEKMKEIARPLQESMNGITELIQSGQRKLIVGLLCLIGTVLAFGIWWGATRQEWLTTMHAMQKHIEATTPSAATSETDKTDK